MTASIKTSRKNTPTDPQRRHLLAWGGLALSAWLLPHGRLFSADKRTSANWPDWQTFAAKHIQPDGRVVDFSTSDQRSTSEGQSYAMFFALCANDRKLFDRVLNWTVQHLAMGYMDQRLPAWLWGKAGDGSWKVLGDNPASDSDLWIAYTLLEAGRLWNHRAYTHTALAMLDLVQAREITALPGLGDMLLPGSIGFALPGQRWRLNPSYLPLQLLHRFAEVRPTGPWRKLMAQTVKLTSESSPLGFAPDWVDWDGKAFVSDPKYGNVGSYDAIRTYLWAGMLDSGEPLRQSLLRALSGPLKLLRSSGKLAEKIDTRNGVESGRAPVGYAGAMLPYLKAQNQPDLLKKQLALIQTAVDSRGQTALPYYERILILFGRGWMDGHFRFAQDGRLQPGWGEK